MIDKAFILVVALLLGVFSAPRTIGAQEAAKVRKVGELHPGSGSVERLGALREAGYVEGQNLIVVRRHAEGRIERLPALAAELVDLKPDVILATGGAAIRAAANATKVIPIVMAFGEDPVGKGLVASLARPGGNITGVSLVAGSTMAAKRIEVLKEAMPRAHRIALLSWPGTAAPQVKEAEQAARVLKVETILVEVRNGDYEGAFAALAAERADALFVLSSPLLNRDRKRIIALAARHRLPAFYEWRESAEEGGLLAYGANNRDLNRRVVALVDKILKGAKAGDLPVEQPTSFELVINMKTAKTLGLAIPPSLLARADYIVE
mgnify:CR=1 FL=1